ncbi:winged helix-turn-helix transcriptional regulator [Parvibaculaceae bacterium PLY_AMNH_Bact1]|nr:winged helix-turn-helix transcriptional regulator [Parvibaculaceae bacterium PLY_AMNH_Bact1]
MRWRDLKDEPCSVARTLSVIGDRWTLMILRDCFVGLRRFEHFEASLGITRHVLADRLKKLVDEGVLKKVPYGEAPVREEYRLTERGFELYPVVLSIVQWGDKHMVDERGAPIVRRHEKCGNIVQGKMVCSDCGEELDARDIAVEAGLGFS